MNATKIKIKVSREDQVEKEVNICCEESLIETVANSCIINIREDIERYIGKEVLLTIREWEIKEPNHLYSIIISNGENFDIVIGYNKDILHIEQLIGKSVFWAIDEINLRN